MLCAEKWPLLCAMQNPLRGPIYYIFMFIKNLSDLSDHCQISVCLQNIDYTKQATPVIEIKENPKGFIWDEKSEFLFGKALCNFQSPINDFLTTKFDCKSGDIDRALNNFNNIIIDAANQSLKKKQESIRQINYNSKIKNGMAQH